MSQTKQYRKSKPKRRGGFTLLETLIVVGILAIVASVVIPAVRSQETQSLESTARILAADIRLARSMAVQHNTEWTVRFDSAANSYELLHTGTGPAPPLANPLAPAGQTDGRYLVPLGQIGRASAQGSLVRLLGAAMKNSRILVSDVTFAPLGGTGPLRGEDTVIWLGTSDYQDLRYVKLTVSWVTGQVWIDPPKMFTAAGVDELF